MLINIVDILRNVSSRWNDVVLLVRIYTADNEMLRLDGRNISWPLADQFPSCQLSDLFDYFNIPAMQDPMNQLIQEEFY